MNLELRRIQFTDKFTIGVLLLNGRFQCLTCEDKVREIEGLPVAEWKVYGETAIPYGTYKVIVNFSNRFKRHLPLLLNVPGFEGIRIHVGNWAKDTDGCILPGERRLVDGVGKSLAAFNRLYPLILNAHNNGEDITMTVTKGTRRERA